MANVVDIHLIMRLVAMADLTMRFPVPRMYAHGRLRQNVRLNGDNLVSCCLLVNAQSPA